MFLLARLIIGHRILRAWFDKRPQPLRMPRLPSCEQHRMTKRAASLMRRLSHCRLIVRHNRCVSRQNGKVGTRSVDVHPSSERLSEKRARMTLEFASSEGEDCAGGEEPHDGG